MPEAGKWTDLRGKWPDFRGFERVGRVISEVERKRKGEGEVRFFFEIQSDNERRQRRNTIQCCHHCFLTIWESYLIVRTLWFYFRILHWRGEGPILLQTT